MEKVLTVGNDVGNSHQKVIIEGEIINQPSCYSKVYQVPNLDLVNADSVMDDIYNNIIMSLDGNYHCCGMCYVGEKSLHSRLSKYDINIMGKKSQSDVYFINTLGVISAHMVKHNLDTCRVNMACSLPVRQYSLEESRKVREKFMGEHFITFHINTTIKKRIKIIFDYIHVLPESVSITFTDSMFDGKNVLHVSIGEGTTEFPITNGIRFNPEFIHGSANGVGHAIENSLDEFCKITNMRTLTRQKFSQFIKDDEHKFHPLSKELLEKHLDSEAISIMRTIEREINKASGDIDMLYVHGGGSIVFKHLLYDELKEICRQSKIQLYYAKSENAVTLESKGLYKFANSEIFRNLKEKYWRMKNNGK